jgi:UDP-N-acetylmuramoyl-L-alanyl-D-glutamate--2,6-diaminopimelate ligase
MMRKLIKALIPRPLFRTIEPYGHWAEALLANIRYGFPARKLRVIGITGTNGKTTTAALVASVLEEAGYSVGVSSTAFFKIGTKYIDNELNMTVTKAFALQKLLRQMVKAKVDFAVLELTSISLAQHRSWGIKPEVAVLTNISQDHLDYHGTMEYYVAAKQRMFRGNPKLQVLNIDDAYFADFNKLPAARTLTYGLKSGAVTPGKLRVSPQGSSFELTYGDYSTPTNLKLAGEYNVYNALAAAAVGVGLGITADNIKVGLEAVDAVPGRMESIDEGQKFGVIVDYAHTPAALENLWKTLKAATKGRLIVVFGATGDRDKTKRPIMGAIAKAIADEIILTDEEPYTENPVDIIRQIEPGLKGKKYQVEVDRRKAIAAAFALAKPGDVVAITGMGHQKYKVVGDTKQPWDDRKVAREELAKLV